MEDWASLPVPLPPFLFPFYFQQMSFPDIVIEPAEGENSPQGNKAVRFERTTSDFSSLAGSASFSAMAGSASFSGVTKSMILREGMNQRDKMAYDIFSLFDQQTGAITHDELPLVLRSLGLSGEHLSYAEVESMRAAMDRDRTGRIFFDEFLQVVTPCLLVPGSFEEQWMMFRTFDRSKKGVVDLDDLLQVANVECNGMLSESQCAWVMSTLRQDSRKQGLAFDDWKKAVTTVLASDTKKKRTLVEKNRFP